MPQSNDLADDGQNSRAGVVGRDDDQGNVGWCGQSIGLTTFWRYRKLKNLDAGKEIFGEEWTIHEAWAKGGFPSMHPALDSLPHGPSFRFVDDLTELSPGHAGVGQYLVRGDEAFLEGHFPGAPLMPGVLLIEALAQLGGVVAQSDPAITPMQNLRLTAVQQAKILGSAVPGETLRLQAKVLGRATGLIMVEGEVTVGERVLLTSRLTLSGQPPEVGG